MILDTVNISVGDVSSWQQTVAWVMLVVIIAAIIAGRLAMRYSWLEDDQRRHLREVRPAIAGATWHRITITDDDNRTSRFEIVGTAMKGNLERTRSGARTALADVHAAAQRHAPVAVPTLAIRGAVEGLLVLAAGLLISIPMVWWERLFGASGSGLSPSSGIDFLETAANGLLWLMSTTVPAGGSVAGLVVATVVLGGRLLTALWLPIGIGLIWAAAILTWLNYKTEDDLDETLYPDRRRALKRAAMWIGAIWGSGALVGFVSELAGVAIMALGTLIAVAVVGHGFVWRILDAAGMDPFSNDESDISPLNLDGPFEDSENPFGDDSDGIPEEIQQGIGTGLEYDPFEAALNLEEQLDETESEWRGEPARPEVAAYLAVRKTLSVAVAVTVPVLVYLVGQAILSGALVRPFAAAASTPVWGKLALIAAPVAVLAYLATHAEGRAADHIRSFRRWFASRLIQSAGFARGVPIVAVVLGGLIGWAYTTPTGALIAATIAGVGSRSVLLLYERGRVRAGKGIVRSGPYLVGGTVFAIVAVRTGEPLGAGMFALVVTGLSLAVRRFWRRYGLGLGESETQSRPPTDQVVEIPDGSIRDADGEPIFVARVDGRPLAARDPETLFHDIQRIVNTRFETGETPTLLSHEFYEDLVGRGVVDDTSVAKSVRGDLATRVVATVKEKGGVDTEVLEDELADEYPHELIEPTLEWLENRQDIGVRDGEYVPIS